MPRPKGVLSYSKQPIDQTEQILISGWIKTKLQVKGYTVVRVAKEANISQAAAQQAIALKSPYSPCLPYVAKILGYKDWEETIKAAKKSYELE